MTTVRLVVGRVGEPVVEATASLIVWEALAAIYDWLGFGQIGDNAFEALVLARIIEPTSKADTVRVLAELGVPGPSRVTFMRCLKRVIARDYRTVIATACYAHAIQQGSLALVLYDLTVRHEALVVRVEVRDHCCGPCRSRAGKLGAA